MEEFAWSWTARQVIGGDCLDGPALPSFGFAIRNRLGSLDSRHHSGRRQNVGSSLAEFGDGSRIHVVRVVVGNQNEVGFWESRELRRSSRVEVNGFSSRLD